MCPECVSVYSRTVRQLLSGSLTHAYEVSLYMRLHPDVTASVSFFFFIFSVSCYPPKMSKLTLVFSLRYVALLRLRLRLRLILRSALHLCRLSPFPIPVLHPPRAYSKMFVGGLSWDTTDGTLSLLILPPFFAMSCQFANSLNCAAVAACDAFISLSMLFL